MTRQLVLLGMILLALLAACAPTTMPTAVPTPAGPALTEVTAVPQPEETMSPDASSPSPYPAPENSHSGAVAPSGTVIVSQLTAEPPVNTTPQEIPAPGSPRDVRVAPELQPLVDAVVSHLSGLRGSARSQIHVAEVAPMTWPSPALGCPDPELGYASVIVEGYRIILEADGEFHAYHTDQGARFVLCVDGRPAAAGQVPEE